LPGTYLITPGASAASSCVKCMAGKYSNIAKSCVCLNCSYGTHSTVVGASNCQICPNTLDLHATWTTTPATVVYVGGPPGPTELVCEWKCNSDLGFKLNREYWVLIGKSRPGLKPSDKDSDNDGILEQEICTCPQGYYLDTAGASAEAQCRVCPVGKYSSVPGNNASNPCLECPCGTYSPGTGASSCEPCMPGTYLCTPGASAASSCVECMTGKYSNIAKSCVCLNCCDGTYASSNKSCALCKVCGAGEYVGQRCSTDSDTTCTRCTQCDWGNEWMQRQCSDSSNHLNIPGNDTVCRRVNTKPLLRLSSVNYNCHNNTYFCCCCWLCC
jgi:hypothetical protein